MRGAERDDDVPPCVLRPARWSGMATDRPSTAYVACPNGSGTIVGFN